MTILPSNYTKKKKPDVALMDIIMPNGSGFHAIRKIQEINPNTRFIVVSGNSNYLTEEKLGIPLIQKQFNLKNLLSIIKA